MKKCIIISDSFKGTLTSGEICGIARECFQEVFPACQLLCVPVADGGEGTVACFRDACGGREVPLRVQGPFGEPVYAAYLQLEGGRAVIEMASCAGLPLAGERRDPALASTYGVGQQIRHAIEQGNRQIFLGLGGSATNDGGCGCAAALGVRFLDAGGNAFIPTGGTLDRIVRIDTAPARALLQDVRLTAMCDIDNPMHGPAGAARVFAPQKGADPAAVEFLDRQLQALDRCIQENLGLQVAQAPGAGAAGAFGAGILAFLGGTLCPGIDAVLDLVGFDAMLAGCQLVITGEGRLDSQSIRGKVISGVSRRAAARKVPVIAVVGGVTPEAEALCRQPESGIRGIFPINREAVDFSCSRDSSHENYARTLYSVLQAIALGEQMERAGAEKEGSLT